jgi:hypothetical protein
MREYAAQAVKEVPAGNARTANVLNGSVHFDLHAGASRSAVSGKRHL